MKILIIALPRTGSTSLMYRLANEKNLKPFFEPFDGTNRVIYNNQNNSVVKTIISHHPNNLELAKSFDEVILLSRKNLKELIESHSYQTYFSKVEGYNSNNKYCYKQPPKNIIDLCTSDIFKWIKEIETLSKILNIEIQYYENLFDINSYNRLRIKNEESKLI